jgi:hypothetical protein
MQPHAKPVVGLNRLAQCLFRRRCRGRLFDAYSPRMIRRSFASLAETSRSFPCSVGS